MASRRRVDGGTPASARRAQVVVWLADALAAVFQQAGPRKPRGLPGFACCGPVSPAVGRRAGGRCWPAPTDWRPVLACFGWLAAWR
jgi:hypothetical protein